MAFEMMPGHLVKCKVQGQMGIVLRVVSTRLTGGKVLIFMGDGLTIEDDMESWDVVPFNDFGVIPASFPEMIEAYKAQVGLR